MPAKVKDEFWKEYDRLKTERDKKKANKAEVENGE